MNALINREALADVLEQLMRAASLTPRQLAQLTPIPEDTLKGWLSGRGRSIREWPRAVLLAATLDLDLAATRRLLRAAGVSEQVLLTVASAWPSDYAAWQETVIAWRERWSNAASASPAVPGAADGPDTAYDLVVAAPARAEDQAPGAGALAAAVAASENPHLRGIPASAPRPAAGARRRLGRWTLAAGLLVVVGLGLWLVRPQVLPPQILHGGVWGPFTDEDVGGVAVATYDEPACVEPPTTAPKGSWRVPGCGLLRGSNARPDGYHGMYRTLAAQHASVDGSTLATVQFRVRGTLSHVRVGIEWLMADGEVREAVCELPVTPDWTTARLPLSAFLPLVGEDPLDRGRLHAISWAVLGTTDHPVELEVDQLLLTP